MSCRVCSTDSQRTALPCLDCLSVACILAQLHHHARPGPPGLSIERMLERVQQGQRFGLLSEEERQTVCYIARHHYRRNKEENDFARAIYRRLYPL